MSLSDEIKRLDKEAGKTLDKIFSLDLVKGKTLEGFTDQKMAALTPEELHQLFPGPECAMLRMTAMKLVHLKREAEDCKKKLKDEGPLKGEEESKNVGHCEPTESSLPPKKKTVKKALAYQTIVTGKTFDADKQLMDKIINNFPNINFIADNKDHKVTILFCPITSRIGADVTAAMSEVKDEKPIILVLMNHSYEPRCVATQRTWDSNKNIVFFVHVFYHETLPGLITCQQNNDAIRNIVAKLEDYCTSVGKDGSQAETPSENQFNEADHAESNLSDVKKPKWGITFFQKKSGSET